MVNKEDCWHWFGWKNNKGYGAISNRKDNKIIMAHRYYYERFVGKIPLGIRVLHHCDNPSCVNPDHLFLGTTKTNALDSIAKDRWADRTGNNTGKAKLTQTLVNKIRERYGVENLTQTQLAKIYGVNHRTINSIILNKSWYDPTYYKINTCPANSHCMGNLIDTDVKKIKTLYATSELTQKQIGAKYNLSQRTISRIIRGEAYARYNQERKT